MSEIATWQQKAKTKRDEVFSLIPPEWRLAHPAPSAEEVRDASGDFVRQFLSTREVQITETDAVGIVQRTSSGQWTAEEVIRAFAHRASLAHQIVNCLHEIFFEAAIQDAKQLDAYYAKHKAPIGPLHGLPVSLKDQFHVKDVDTHMGYVSWIGTFQGKTGTGRERVFESEMVKELRALGAVLYCKTAVPHSLMRGETINNIIGYTQSGRNRLLSSGGSSGGEGALIAMKGSPIGFGTDIGGSIRIPAAFNGLYGLRPSSGRLPYEGMANTMDGQISALSVVGPLSHSVPSLRLAVKALLSQEPWNHDPNVNEIPWREEHDSFINEQKVKGGLVFGIARQDSNVTPWPPIKRALETTIEKIQKAGHKVIEWDISSHTLAHELISKTWFYDGGTDIHKDFSSSGEDMSPGLMYEFAKAGPIDQANATDIAANNIAIRDFRKEYMERWNSTKDITGTGRPMDGIICPLAPSPSSEPLQFRYYNYTTWVNLLDYPSCVVPITYVDKKIDVPYENFKPLSEMDSELIQDYKPDVFHGAPVALQIIGRRLQEEKTLALAEYIASLVHAHSAGISRL